MATVSVFKGTVGFKIKLALGIDVSAVGAVVKIKYIKPDESTTGEWTAVIENAATGLISYTTTVADGLDQAGVWKFNGVYDPTGDDIFFGATACLEVLELGSC
jgi:hypothetical protein